MHLKILSVLSVLRSISLVGASHDDREARARAILRAVEFTSLTEKIINGLPESVIVDAGKLYTNGMCGSISFGLKDYKFYLLRHLEYRNMKGAEEDVAEAVRSVNTAQVKYALNSLLRRLSSDKQVAVVKEIWECIRCHSGYRCEEPGLKMPEKFTNEEFGDMIDSIYVGGGKPAAIAIALADKAAKIKGCSQESVTPSDIIKLLSPADIREALQSVDGLKVQKN